MNICKLFFLILLNISFKTITMTADYCLLEAARTDDLFSIKQALRLYKNININAQCPVFKNSALHLAVLRKNATMTKTLLEHGALPNIQNYEGKTPLHIAIKECSGITIIHLLITNKADLSIKDHHQKTAADYLNVIQKQLLPIFLATLNQHEYDIDQTLRNKEIPIKKYNITTNKFMLRVHANLLCESLTKLINDNPTINQISTKEIV